METLYGMKVVVNPNIPRLPAIQIDPKFEWCSDEYRAKHNAWLIDRFGYVDQVLIMTEPFSGQQVVMMQPKHYALLKMQAHKTLEVRGGRLAARPVEAEGRNELY